MHRIWLAMVATVLVIGIGIYYWGAHTGLPAHQLDLEEDDE